MLRIYILYNYYQHFLKALIFFFTFEFITNAYNRFILEQQHISTNSESKPGRDGNIFWVIVVSRKQINFQPFSHGTALESWNKYTF